MATYRILGNRTFECSAGEHTFRVLIHYEYATKRTTYEVTDKNGEWIPPEQREPHTYLPQCPTCGECPSFEGVTVGSGGRVHNAQVGEKEATAVAIHPKTGEAVYCFFDPAAPMPEEYRAEGFQKVQFHHYHELERFCRERGLVNEIEGDYHHDDGYFEEDLSRRRKEEQKHKEWYLEEREKVKRANRRN